jgi:hypothetical protein
MENQDFVSFLKSEFEKRREHKKTYSLAAFARFLKIESSRLRKILKYQRPLNKDLIQQIALKLQLQEDQTNGFIEEIEQVNCSTVLKRLKTSSIMMDFAPPDLQNDWLALAVLELMKMSDFKRDDHWIASQLEVTEDQVKNVIRKIEEWKASLPMGLPQPVLVPLGGPLYIATNPKQVQKAEQLIQEFQRALISFLNESSEKSHLYQLNFVFESQPRKLRL